MAFHRITPAELGREDVYRHFMEDAPCTYNFTAETDVTHLRTAAKARGAKFFPALLHCITASVNAFREFRMSFDAEGQLGYYDSVDPCYTVFHENAKRFSDVWTKFDGDFDVFYARYREDMRQYGGADMKPSKPYEGENLFNVSCIPWASFTGFDLNLQKGYRWLPPIFTVGKYFEREGKLVLPLAVRVHHAVCDGYHVAMFLQDLQRRMDTF